MERNMLSYADREQNMFSHSNNHSAICRVLLNKVVDVVARVSRSSVSLKHVWVVLSCLVLCREFLASYTRGLGF